MRAGAGRAGFRICLAGLALLGRIAMGGPGADPALASIYEQGPVRPVNPSSDSASDAMDALVFGQMRALGIEPANLCSDAVFLRRAYVDVIGTLPTGRETLDFLQSQEPDKRAQLIDRLLEREEFNDYWANKWSDLLRVKAEFPINLWPNAVQAYHRYIRESVRQNKPYDQFARELLTGNGSNFRVGQVNFYRAMQSKEPRGIAQTVALTFMGVRADRWPQPRLDGMAGFFAQVGYKSTAEWKEEIVYRDPARDTNGLTGIAVFPDGTKPQLTAGQDPREVFADWLTTAENPWFTRSIANRVWSWFLGRGIIQEPDDLRPDNPPSNPRLLAFLERELVRSQYDLRHVMRVILNSQTYQLSPLPKTDTPEAAANFAFCPLRRLDAEVLIDALNQLTGSSEEYSSPIPEPFTFIPVDQRAIALPDGSITSPFLESFGRPPRDTGLESERNNAITAGQRLHLLNSSHIQQKIEGSPMVRFQTQSDKKPRAVVSALYVGILSRYPAPEEVERLAPLLTSKSSVSREAVVDLTWALLNSAEFLYRH
ncbi:MAG: DUF1549 and DUF1553 domain-containing protein [Verrucomicrobia bacterium]|jgi:hypothetical protein|nr:DUF1549 and DUF1553 domain-containing protein [Verrucomicrobiota bacterium]